jgi:putative acetyltransferase
MLITPDDLSGLEIRTLLSQHLAHLKSITPMESGHALDVDALKNTDVTFWSAWDAGELVGCGALRELSPDHGEIKSMRTSQAHLRKGVARHLVAHIIGEARRRSYKRVSLETGVSADFEPAQRLYESCGFRRCPPFGPYADDPFSLCMTLDL